MKLDHLTVEERLTHIEEHIATGIDHYGCDLCHRVTRGY